MYGMCFLSEELYRRGLEKDVGELGGGGCGLYIFRQKWRDLKGDFEKSRKVWFCIHGTGMR